MLPMPRQVFGIGPEDTAALEEKGAAVVIAEGKAVGAPVGEALFGDDDFQIIGDGPEAFVEHPMSIL